MQGAGSAQVVNLRTDSPLADGTYSLVIRATDKVGFAKETPPMQVVVDTTPPVFSGVVVDTLTLNSQTDVRFLGSSGSPCAQFSVSDPTSAITRSGLE